MVEDSISPASGCAGIDTVFCNGFEAPVGSGDRSFSYDALQRLTEIGRIECHRADGVPVAGLAAPTPGVAPAGLFVELCPRRQ